MSGDDIDLDDMLGPEPAPAPAQLSPSRELAARSRSYPVPGGRKTYAKKNRPELLKRAIQYAAEVPLGTNVARRLGRSYATLRYWLVASKEGAPGDGFDIVLGDDDENGTPDNTVRFHEAWEDAINASVEDLEAAVIKRGTGYNETLTYQGRVQYKYDPVKLATSRELGVPEYVPENYLLDKFNAPVPESVFKMDPDLAMFILKARKPQIYGAKASLDVNVKGGVLVVGMQVKNPEDLNQIESDYRRNGQQPVIFDDREGEE